MGQTLNKFTIIKFNYNSFSQVYAELEILTKYNNTFSLRINTQQTLKKKPQIFFVYVCDYSLR